MKDIIDGSSIANTNNKLSVKNLNLNLESSKKKIYWFQWDIILYFFWYKLVYFYTYLSYFVY